MALACANTARIHKCFILWSNYSSIKYSYYTYIYVTKWTNVILKKEKRIEEYCGKKGTSWGKVTDTL